MGRLIRYEILISLVLGLSLNAIKSAEFFVTTPAEISSAARQAQPGDTLTMADGEWMNVTIVFEAVGEENAPILLRAATPGAVRITGRSNLRMAGSYLVVEGLYFTAGYSPSGAVVEFRNGSSKLAYNSRLTSCAIVDFNPSSKSTDYKWVSMYGQYNRVDHCYFRGKNHSGTTLVVWMDATPDYHLIDHNYFAYRPDFGANGAETIRVGTSDWSMYDSFTTVEYNFFEECNGEIEIISNKSCENTYRYNTFYKNKGTLTLRHGNRCYVYGNYFFGQGVSNSGGVRVIGESHLIYNNYFQDLTGTGFRAALALVNGVPNSPLNRYFQVKNARLLFNTFVNCFENIVVGAGANSELSLPPKDCLFANNLISTKFNNEMVTFQANPINLTWQGNIFYGPDLGIDQPPGIDLTDPMMVFAEDSLYRPDSASVVVDAAQGSFEFITEDMDGQTRNSPYDVGADEWSDAPVLRRPVWADDTGPNWFPPPPPPENVRYVHSGPDSLRNAILQAMKGQIIELVDAGIYTISAPIVVDQMLSIRAGDSLSARPVIINTAENSPDRSLFEMHSKGILRMSGVELSGQQDTPTLIRTNLAAPAVHYSIFADDCLLRGVGADTSSAFLMAFSGSLGDTVRFENCLFTESEGRGFSFAAEQKNSGKYDITWLELNNCTFWDIKGPAVDVYAGDEIPFTTGPVIKINHATFDRCALDSSAVINAEECDFTTIRNSIFSNSPGSAARLYGFGASIGWSDIFQTASAQLFRSAWTDNGMVSLNPGYADAENGDFTLFEGSPVVGRADDGEALGDLRWAAGITGLPDFDPGVNAIKNLALYQNYPNPFNAATRIRYFISPRHAGQDVDLSIYNMLGQRIARLVQGVQNPGIHSVNWQAGQQPSAVYLVVLTAGKDRTSRKMILVK